MIVVAVDVARSMFTPAQAYVLERITRSGRLMH